MTGFNIKNILRKLNKKDLKLLKEAIEEAGYKAIDEYKKNLNSLM